MAGRYQLPGEAGKRCRSLECPEERRAQERGLWRTLSVKVFGWTEKEKKETKQRKEREEQMAVCAKLSHDPPFKE